MVHLCFSYIFHECDSVEPKTAGAPVASSSQLALKPGTGYRETLLQADHPQLWSKYTRVGCHHRPNL